MDLRGLSVKPYFYYMETHTLIVEISGLFYSNRLGLETRDRAGEKKDDTNVDYIHLYIDQLPLSWKRTMPILSLLSMFGLSQ